MKNLNTKQRIFVSLALLGAVVAALLVTSAFTLKTHAAPGQYSHKVQLTFAPDHWSQQVWVPANWGFTYICDGASTNDTAVVEDEYNTPNGGTGWDTAIPHIHLICDNQWHGTGINWKHAHIVVIGSTRPLEAFIMR